MLELKDITKDYKLGPETIHALSGLDISFPNKGFISILGPSGCGKTTLLNIIGGLDQYTEGDLIINNKSTQDFNSRDWDNYRNHHIGFVFQNYSLIPHQTLLENVELAPTIAGLSKLERRSKAKTALESVGLADRMKQKPNQVSGGQSQRAAIARALVTDPNIILADEPTGALDSKTSVQVMNILKKISKDKLVIMVTHNEDLAGKYSDRIVRLLDGKIESDYLNPSNDEENNKDEKVVATETETENENETNTSNKPIEKQLNNSNKSLKPRSRRQAHMSFFTSLSLSWHNLISNKGKTFLTALAGSIGIIGISIIYAISVGVNNYITNMQQETLSSYPLLISRKNLGLEAVIEDYHKLTGEAEVKPENKIEAKVQSWEVMSYILDFEKSLTGQVNNLKDFSIFLEEDKDIQENVAAIHYFYDINMPVYTKDTKDVIIPVNIMEQISNSTTRLEEEGVSVSAGRSAEKMVSMSNALIGDYNVFSEIIPDVNQSGINQIIKDQYILKEGKWPEKANEIVLVVNSYGETPDFMWYILGLRSQEDLDSLLKQNANNEEISSAEGKIFSYDELMKRELKLIFPGEFYQKNDDDKWEDLRETREGLEYLYNSDDLGLNLKIVGIIEENPEAQEHALRGWIGYNVALTDLFMERNRNTPIVQEQLKNKEIDVFSGLEFPNEQNTNLSDTQKADEFRNYAKDRTVEEKAEFYTWLNTQMPETELENELNKQLETISKVEKDELVASIYSKITGVSTAAANKAIKSLSAKNYDELLKGGVTNSIQMRYSTMAMAKLENIPVKMRAELFKIEELSEKELVSLREQFIPSNLSDSSYDDNLSELLANLDEPEAIYIYNDTFEGKDKVEAAIERYNRALENKDDEITYTDFVAIVFAAIQEIVNIVTYVLIGFVSLSLIVSSIMIAIITYISVLQRIREIGILRSLGASKANVSQVFIAETLIEGFAAGVFGIVISNMIIAGINGYIHNNLNFQKLTVFLPFKAVLVLIAISVFLTVIAGLVPAFMASKKDPVEALRSE